MQLAPPRDDAADEGQELAGGMRVERGGRLVENDEVERLLGHGEGAGDLDHLAPADRKVADDVAGADAVAGKDLVELAADQLAGPAPPAEAGQRRVHDAGILGHRQVRAERELLEDAADAERLCERAPNSWRCSLPATVMRPRSGASVPARTCISVDLPAPLWPTRPTHSPRIDGEIDAVQRADGAEMLFDAVQPDDVRACLSHQRQRPSRVR